MPTQQPRCVLYDIETTHNLAAVFQLFDKYNNGISPENILQERYIVCAAWKVLGEKTVHAVSTLDDPTLYKKDPHNDRHVVETLHEVLGGADVIIAHNGDQYDTKFTDTRILAHGLSPLPPIPSIDTLKVARNRFLFNSNRLDYLGHFLNVGRKRPTTSGLWLRVLQGDASAIREMVGYNKQDVQLLERVFLKLQPYVPNHLNRHLFGQTGCPRCGSLDVQARGYRYAVSQKYQRFQCNSCGGWFREARAHTKGVTTRVL